MKKWLSLLLLLFVIAPVVGCEAEGRIDDNGDDAKLEIDVDD